MGEAIHATHGAEPLVRAALLHLLWTQELVTDLSKVVVVDIDSDGAGFVVSGAGVRIGVGTRVMYDGAVHEVTRGLRQCVEPMLFCEVLIRYAGCRWWIWSVAPVFGC